MAFGGFENSSESPMNEINMIPLIDVMLVLLVIFIITAPILTHAIKIDLPQATNVANDEKPDTITLAVDERGQLFWNDAPIGEAELAGRLAAAAAGDPEVSLHLRADKMTRYELLARIMAVAQEQGVARIGFVTDPTP